MQSNCNRFGTKRKKMVRIVVVIAFFHFFFMKIMRFLTKNASKKVATQMQIGIQNDKVPTNKVMIL